MALEDVIKVTFCILDADVLRLRHDPFVGIGIFYLAIKSHTLDKCRAVEWLTVVQQHILKFNKYTVYECILIISKHWSRNCVSPVLINLCTDSQSKVGNSEILWWIAEWGWFDSSAHFADMGFCQTMYLLWYRVEWWLHLTMLAT